MQRRARIDIRQAGQKILIGMGLAAALNAAFYVVYVQPEIKAYRNLQDENTPEFDLLADQRETTEKLERFLEGVRKAEADLLSLHEEILSTRDQRLVEVQAELAQLCAEFNIDLESVDYGNDSLPDSHLDRLVMKVPLEGGYSNLRRFLQAVENSSKFLLVEKVSLSKGKAGGRLLSLSINMATYFSAPEEMIELNRASNRRVRS